MGLTFSTMKPKLFLFLCLVFNSLMSVRTFDITAFPEKSSFLSLYQSSMAKVLEDTNSYSSSVQNKNFKAPVMIWRLGGPKKHNGDVSVTIESPSMNSRRISGSIIVDAPVDDVWKILTDYDNLATHVPNLVQSRKVFHPENGIRLFQEGAQNIIGFDFRASLTMDMTEVYEKPDEKFYQRKILFQLVESAMFNGFNGEWRVQNYSRMKNPDASGEEGKYIYTSKVFYVVEVRPRGPVPVAALEWQIKSEVPKNLQAVKIAAEKIKKLSFGNGVALGASNKIIVKGNSDKQGWEEDETLDMYSFAEKGKKV
mmetsp:Transcript_30139/g.39696  ORF Transcript_30139/g.39696 Transcript_30139/m.39696 type:complete len:311 (-) Transcript_30139:557-1489(-)